MNLTLSKRGDYVVRSALSLARAYSTGEYRKIREVVAEMGVPQTFASQILKDLVNANLAESRAGKDGGYRLSKDPAQIDVLSVVEAGEGPLKSDRCALGDGPCRWDQVCPLHAIWTQATLAMRRVLEKTSLSDLVDNDMAIESGLMAIPVDSHRHNRVVVDIRDSIQIEFDSKKISARFSKENWLVPVLKRSFGETDLVRHKVAPTYPAWAIDSVDVLLGVASQTNPLQPLEDFEAEHVQTPEDLKTNQPTLDRSKRTTYKISWEATTVNGLSLHFDGYLVLEAVDAARSQVVLEGKLRPPTSDSETEISSDQRKVIDNLATTAIRTCLRQIAATLEEASEVDRIATLLDAR